MAENKKNYYASSYGLKSLIHGQQSIPRKYKSTDYFGSAMRVREEKSAQFLSDFINDTVIILPEYYDLMETVFAVLQHSGFKPIKKLLPQATAKYKTMLRKLRARQEIAKKINPINTNASQNSPARYSVLENKKKMMLMSCSNICVLGDAINAEYGFNTTRLKNKFACFASYRIEMVLTGQMPIDPDFNMLLTRYGTPQQIKRYNNLIYNKSASRRKTPAKPAVQPAPVKDQNRTPKQNFQNATRKLQQKNKQQPTTQNPAKKTGFGLFGKLKKSIKSIGNGIKNIGNTAKTIGATIKKPLLVGGIFAMSLFGGKRLYDAAVEQNNLDTLTEYYATNTPQTETTSVSDTVNNAKSAHANDSIIKTNDNTVMKKTVNQLRLLKANNPTDRNMNVEQTANRLYKKFGDNTYNVVLASAMAPYAMNNSTKFDFRPSTHNMIEYLSTHDLTPAQKTALEKFIATHVKNNSINMNKFAAYNMQNQR